MKESAGINNLMHEVGKSFFLYDLDLLEQKLQEINQQLKNHDMEFFYACKANPLSSILSQIQKLGWGIDVASLGELNQALTANFNPQKVIATGPAKSVDYLRTLVENNISCIIIESINQLKDLHQIAQNKNIKTKVLLRLQLDWETGASVLGGNEITPFGLGFADWQVINLTDYPNLDVMGVHIFQWGNILDIITLTHIWEKSIQNALAFADQMKFSLKIIDLGGGLGVPYHKQELALSFSSVVNQLSNLQQKYLIPKIWMELGRYTTAECGKYFTKIIDIKTVRGKNLIITEGGINHLARPALTKESFPVTAYKNKNEKEKTYTIHGPLCTSLDKLGTYQLPENLQENDWLCFHQVGAYGFTESMPYFLCHEQAAEISLKNGEYHINRKADQASHWLV